MLTPMRTRPTDTEHDREGPTQLGSAANVVDADLQDPQVQDPADYHLDRETTANGAVQADDRNPPARHTPVVSGALTASGADLPLAEPKTSGMPDQRVAANNISPVNIKPLESDQLEPSDHSTSTLLRNGTSTQTVIMLADFLRAVGVSPSVELSNVRFRP